MTEMSLGCESWIRGGLQGIHSVGFSVNVGVEKGGVIAWSGLIKKKSPRPL